MTRSRRVGCRLLSLIGLLLVGCGGSGDTVVLPGVVFSTRLLNFAADQSTATFELNPGGPEVAWSLSPSNDWLSATPVSGVGPATITVTVDRSDLPPGEHTGALRVVTVLGSPALPVTVIVLGGDGPVLAVSPAVLDFGSTTTELSLEIVNTGGGTLEWSLSELGNWLLPETRRGTGPASIPIRVNRATLAAGSYSGALRVVSNGGSAIIPVTLQVGGGAPVAGITVDPLALAFGTTANQRTLTIHSNNGVLPWSAAGSAAWVDVTPQSGSGDATLTVTVDRAALGLGAHTATVTVLAGTNGTVATIVVPITLLNPGDGAQPSLAVSPAQIHVAPGETEKTLSVANVGLGTLTWSIAADAWIAASPSSGTGAADVTLTIDAGAASAGGVGQVVVTSNGGSAAIEVRLTEPTLGGPILGVAPRLLDFDGAQTQLPLGIVNQGSGTLSWALQTNRPWIMVNPANGTGDGTPLVTIDRGQLQPGNNVGGVTVVSNVGTINVVVAATSGGGGAGLPQAFVTPTLLQLGAVQTQGQFTVVNVGGGTLNWQIASDSPWLTAAPAAGAGNATITATVDRAGLAAGPHTGRLSFTSDGGNAEVVVQIDVP